MPEDVQEFRPCVNLAIYAGPGLENTISEVADTNSGYDLMARSVLQARSIVNDLVIFDRCDVVISDFSELIGLAHVLREHLAKALRLGRIRLFRTKSSPAFFRPGVDSKIDDLGHFIGAVFDPWSEKDEFSPADLEKLFDDAAGRMRVEGLTEFLLASKQAVLDNVSQLNVRHTEVGQATLADMAAWLFGSDEKREAAADKERFVNMMGDVMAEQGLDYMFPSYYSHLDAKQTAAPLQLFQRQFLFNLATSISMQLNVRDYHVVHEECARLAMGRLLAHTGFEDGSSDRKAPLDATHNALRLITLAGLPDPATSISGEPDKVGKFIELIQSDEAIDFRSWYHACSGESPDDIVAAYIKLLSRPGLTESTPGRVSRYLLGNAVGFVPVIGPAAGLVFSTLDTFLLDRVVDPKKPKLFLEELAKIER